MGHYMAAKQSKLNVGAPCFIPFVGAWIQLKEQPMNAEVEAFVGMAGPLVGSAAAFLCYPMAESNGSMLLMAIAYAGFMLNLFNLITITPLDGGRIVSVISPRIWYIGIPILIGLFIWRPSPMLLLLAIMFVPKVFEALKNKNLEQSAYYMANGATRKSYAVQYLMLVLFLATSSFRYRPRVSDFIETTTILTQRDLKRAYAQEPGNLFNRWFIGCHFLCRPTWAVLHKIGHYMPEDLN